MEAKIKLLAEKKLVGIRMKMTFSDNKTGDLWRGFMPGCKEVKNKMELPALQPELSSIYSGRGCQNQLILSTTGRILKF